MGGSDAGQAVWCGRVRGGGSRGSRVFVELGGGVETGERPRVGEGGGGEGPQPGE